MRCTAGCSSLMSLCLERWFSTLYNERACGRSQEDVRNQRCAEEGCKHRPVFNAPGKTRGHYCEAHARPGMVRPDCLSLRHGAQAPTEACLTIR